MSASVRSAVVEYLRTNPTAGPREIASALHVSPSTAHSHLKALKGSTMPNVAPTLAAAIAATPATPAAASADPEAAARAMLEQAQAALKAAQEAKAQAAEREAAEKAAREAELAELAKRAKAKAEAEAVRAAKPAPVQAQPLAQSTDLPPILSRWRFTVPDAMGKGWVGRKQELALLAAWLADPQGRPAGLTGPKGSGKTSLLREACARAGRPFARINGHRDMVSSDLLGCWLTRSDRSLAWSDGPLPAAMRAGACLLVDEFDRIPSGTASAMQAVLEGDALTIAETGEVVQAAPGFQVCISANSIGDKSGGYAATLPVDDATLDRFDLLLRVDAMGKADLRRMLKATVPALEEARREACLMFHEALTEAANKGDLNSTPSPRRLLALGRWLAGGLDPVVAVAATYADRLDPTEGETVRSMASRIVTPDAALLQAALEEAKREAAADAGLPVTQPVPVPLQGRTADTVTADEAYLPPSSVAALVKAYQAGNITTDGVLIASAGPTFMRSQEA